MVNGDTGIHVVMVRACCNQEGKGKAVSRVRNSASIYRKIALQFPCSFVENSLHLSIVKRKYFQETIKGDQPLYI